MKFTHPLLISLMAATIMVPVAVTARPASPATPIDPHHRELASLAGTWSVRQSFWSKADAAPKIDRGTAEFAMILNRQHLRQTLRIDDGTHFEGLGYIGYDNGAGEFFSTWMDVNFPGMVVARGRFDAGTRTYIFRGSMAAPTPGGSEIPVREVMTMIDRDHFTYEYFEAHGGPEMLTVRLEYSRVH
jgi:hypothetical protein